MLGRDSRLSACRIAALFLAVSCAPYPAAKTAEAKAPQAKMAIPAQAAPAPTPFVPSLQQRRDATQLRVFHDRSFVLWNGLFVATGDWASGKPRFTSNSPFAATGTVDLFTAETGARFQWLRVDEAVEDGWIARDSVVFYGREGNKLGQWNAGESLSSVFFGRPTLAIKGKQLVEVTHVAAKVILEDVGRARQILSAGYVLCRERWASESFDLRVNASAGCESSAGWRFEGNWFSHPPLACDGRLIEFLTPSGNKQWSRMIIRDLGTGAIQATVQERGMDATCMHDRVVEVATGRSWAAVDGRRLPRLTCGQRKPKLWAASKNLALCMDQAGELHEVKITSF